MNNRIWCIGDIHGCFETFKELISKIPENEKIYLVGDMIDRGPKTKDLLEFIINNDRIEAIIGNHEQLMLVCDQMEVCEFWDKIGGQETIESYYEKDGKFNEDIFQKHVNWLKTLPMFRLLKYSNHKDLLISHSLMIHLWETVLTEQTVKDSQWQHFLNLEFRENVFQNSAIYNIFGHTIQDKPVVNNNFACIDIGPLKNRKMCALSYPDLQIIEVENTQDFRIKRENSIENTQKKDI